MVLKVVRGKILETLELACAAAAAIRFLMLRLGSGAGSRVVYFHQDGSWLAQIGTVQRACGAR